MLDTVMDQETQLFKSCQFARLSIDHANVEQDLKNNLPLDCSPNSGFVKSLFIDFDNSNRSYHTSMLQQKKSLIDSRFADFISKNNHVNISKDAYTLKANVNFVFRNDTYGLERINFAIRLIYDEEYKYEYYDVGLNHISQLIFDDESFIIWLKNSIENLSSTLAQQPMSTTGKIAVSGIMDILGVGWFGLKEWAMDKAPGLFSYMSMNFKGKPILDDFNRLDYQQLARILAIECICLLQEKSSMPYDMFNEKLAEFLNITKEIKNYVDYMILIEKKDVDYNVKKLHVVHNLDMEMIKRFS